MILTGLARLGRDATVRDAGDNKVANLSLAYNYGKKGTDGKRPSVWIDASLWGDRAEKLAPYLVKGQQLSVVLDDVFPATFEGQGGTKSVLKARVVSIEFAGSKPEGAKPAEQKAPASAPARKGAFDDFEDDIPF